MTKLSQNVEFTASDKGLDSILRRAETKIDGFLKRSAKFQEATGKFAQIGSIALGAGPIGAVVGAPFRLTGALTDSLAASSSRAAASVADFRSGKLRQLSDTGLTPGIAALLASREREYRIDKARRDSVGDLFAAELAMGDAAGGSGYLRNFTNGLRAIGAGGGAFIANINKGYSYASRASDLATWQAQADTDAESNYWLAMRAREGNAGAKEEMEAISKLTWERIRSEQSSGSAKTFDLLRKQFAGF